MAVAGQAAPCHLRLVSIFGWGLLGPHSDPGRETAQEVVGGFNLKCLQVTLRAEQKAWDHRARSESDRWPLRFHLPPQHVAALSPSCLSPEVTPSFLSPRTPRTPHHLPHPGSQQEYLPSKDIIIFCNMIGI